MITRRIRNRTAVWINFFSLTYYRAMGIKIGKHSYISLGAHLDVKRGKIVLGDNVSIGRGSFLLSHVGFKSIPESQKTVLEDNVKVFVNSVILPGVHIGKNSIVGAGSVVMKNVPSNVLVMGNPARIVQHLDERD